MRFHNVQGQGLGGADGEAVAEAAKVTPELSLSSLEYYLFTFAWVRRGGAAAGARTRGTARRMGQAAENDR